MAEVPLRIAGLSKTFRGLRRSVAAVRDVTLEVEPGSVVAFVGPNGAGKTTTIYAVLGLLRPTRGTITVFGQPAGSVAARRRVGFVSEIFYTYPYRTARDAMRFYGRLSGLAGDDLEARIPRWLERLGLGDAIDRKVGRFSKGMVQRLGLAQALLHDPDLLVLDEPTTGLDPEGRRLVAEIVLEEKARGRAIFLSSHILSDVERTCDRVVMIRSGEVVLVEPIASLGRNADEWEIEVSGWDAGLAARLGPAGYTVAREGDGTAWLRCAASARQELLHRLVAAEAVVGTVRPVSSSLEELYMRHVGGTSSG